MKSGFVTAVAAAALAAGIPVAGMPAVAGEVAVAGMAPAEAGQARTTWDGIYTEEQAARGEPLYQEWCASCHAPDLSGGDLAPGLVGGEFVWNWSGITVGQLFERLRISMPQENPSNVTRAEKADILAFMLYVNEFPAGEHELADRTNMLEQIMFEAIQP